MRGRSPFKIIAGLLMLAALYVWCYREGIVQEFTTKAGLTNPGMLQVPEGPAPVKDAPARTTSAPAAETSKALANPRVAGLGSSSGYTREQLGTESVGVDANGCNARDLTTLTFTADDPTCRVASSAYTAAAITFVPGQGTSSAVQVDHVVESGEKAAMNDGLKGC